jgi:broad specificity phosphatase PhoE
MGIKFDKMITSPFKCAIQTAKYVCETCYTTQDEEKPFIELMFSIHEFGGLTTRDADGNRYGEPGIDSQEAKDLMPELIIAEEKVKLMEGGWW